MQFVYRFTLTLVVFSATSCFAQEQTLTQQLLQESSEMLVRQARESGDIVRGAILFHQGNINCAKCHQPATDKNRLGPDLSRLDKKVTDVSLVEAILEPSKAISKGYETFNVAKVDGRVISGLVVSQDDNIVVLRDSQNIEKLLQIPRADIEELVSGKVSVMPSKLADQLKSRQQFLDLLRYVINVKERGPSETLSPAQAAPARRLSPELNGLVLIQEHSCAACHESDLVD
ncbi:c-type cytochrome, partial [Planctomicrobium sp.]